MPVSKAVRRGKVIDIYDEKGRPAHSIGLGRDPKDGLVGYTSTTVSIRHGGAIHVYNDKGAIIKSYPA